MCIVIFQFFDKNYRMPNRTSKIFSGAVSSRKILPRAGKNLQNLITSFYLSRHIKKLDQNKSYDLGGQVSKHLSMLSLISNNMQSCSRAIS